MNSARYEFFFVLASTDTFYSLAMTSYDYKHLLIKSPYYDDRVVQIRRQDKLFNVLIKLTQSCVLFFINTEANVTKYHTQLIRT